MESTKLTFSIFNSLEKKLKTKLERLNIKRDAFVEHLLSIELEHLAETMKNKKNHPKAKTLINQKMDKKRKTTPLTIVVSKALANRMYQLMKQHNISRDAFINRLFIFLLLEDAHLSRLGIPTHSSDIEAFINLVDRAPTSPLAALEYWLDDPLYFIREHLLAHGEYMYLTDLDALQNGLTVMTSCYLDNTEQYEVPEDLVF